MSLYAFWLWLFLVCFQTKGIVAPEGSGDGDVNAEATAASTGSNGCFSMYPCGQAQHDESFTGNGVAVGITPRLYMPVGDGKSQWLSISEDGYVIFDEPRSTSTPKPTPAIPHKRILFPYWTNAWAQNDHTPGGVSGPHGVVYYHIYDKGSLCLNTIDDSVTDSDYAVFSKVTSDLLVYGEITDFNPVWVLVTTWSKLVHLNAYYNPFETITYQLIIASDLQSRTYAFYMYGRDDMLWNSNNRPTIGIGFKLDNRVFDVQGSRSQSALRIDGTIGSTGCAGFWIFEVSHLFPGPSNICQSWYCANAAVEATEMQLLNARLPQCPCTMFGASVHPGFILVSQPTRFTFCFYTRFLTYGFTGARECCYDVFTFSLFVSSRGCIGHVVRFHPIFYWREHRLFDLTPKLTCCNQPHNNFVLFNDLRPILLRCVWVRIRIAVFWGDPHIKSLDGYDYTFNGLGEFTLLNVIKLSPADQLDMTIQGRTCLAVDAATGQTTRATVFCAFAAKDYVNDFHVQVKLTDNKQSLNVEANGGDFSLDFQANRLSELHATWSLEQPEPNKVVVSFVNGMGFNVTVTNGLLDISFVVPEDLTATYRTEGLFGVLDSNVTNDFTLQNGTEIPINSTEETIFTDFGEQWAVTEATSIFTYKVGESVASMRNESFVPFFMEDYTAEQRQDAVEVCGSEDLNCQYDYLTTNDAELAISTKATNEESTAQIAEAQNIPPTVVVVPSAVNIKVGQAVEIAVTGSDNDTDDTVTVRLLDDVTGSTLTDGMFRWTPTSTDPVRLRFVAVDSKQTISQVEEVDIKMCTGCTNHGTCLFSSEEAVDGGVDFPAFAVVPCGCESGYVGSACETDFDGCASEPCPAGTDCTDLLPEDSLTFGRAFGRAYNCSSCPDGWELIDAECIDINECSSDPSPCAQLCGNTDGSYQCSCEDGYRLRERQYCDDINECAEQTSGCQQLCINHIGSSATCDCRPGFDLDDMNGKDCLQSVDPCDGLSSNCSYGCEVNDAGEAECFCASGYMVANITECQDINECEQNPCSHICTNTDGAFVCSCFSGNSLKSDKRECEECEFGVSWGLDCSESCDCSVNSVQCSPVTGCQCSTGWQGTLCSENINECDTVTCQAFSTCVDSQGSYSCDCDSGYQKDANGFCQNINECGDETLNTCQQECTDTQGGFSCFCRAGFIINTTDSTQCDDIDECADETHNCQHLCNNRDGLFTCSCHPGYDLDDDRHSCTLKEDPCVDFPTFVCDTPGVCIFSGVKPACTCPTGYQQNAEQNGCDDIAECDISTTCNQICTELEGSFRCSCNNGFTLENDKKSCRACDEFHWGVNCANVCDCGPGVSVCDNVNGCECKPGWLIGATLKCDVNVIECDASPCNDTYECIDTVGSFRCVCPTGYIVGVNDTCEDENECTTNKHDCAQNCVNTPGSYTCNCHTGFADTLSTGRVCDDIHECDSGTSACDQICTNTRGSYICSCDAGYDIQPNNRDCVGNSSRHSMGR